MTSPRARRVAAPPIGPASPGTRAGAASDAAWDYASAFELTTPDARSRPPEQWARATFEGAPALFQRILLIGWTVALGLRLGPRPSPDHVLGWRIADSSPDAMTVEAHSRLISAQNIVLLTPSVVSWVTVVRFHRRAGRVIWALAAPIHHLTLPWLLQRAARSAVRR